MRRLLALALLLPLLASASVPPFSLGFGFGGTSAGGSLSITTSSLAGATIGSAYSQTLAASGGSGSYTFSQVSATPDNELWLYVTPTGTVSGTPEYAETENVTYQVTDSDGDTAQKTFSVVASTSGSLTINTSTTLPAATSGSFYALPINISGGTPPYSCSGTTAQPWTITVDCWIEGTPTSTGSNSFGTITVTDNVGATATFSPSVTIGSTLVLANIDQSSSIIRLPPGIAGQYYQAQLNAYGGSGSGYTYSATSGLPGWATLGSSTGLITGTPSASGNVQIALKVTDSSSNTATANGLINISSGGTVSRPSYNSSTSNGFFVKNGLIYDPNGYWVHLNGLDRTHFDSNTWASGANGGSSGANIVRMFNDLYDSPSYGNSMAVVAAQNTPNGQIGILSMGTVPAFMGAGTVSGTVLTVTSVAYGSLAVGQTINLTALPYGTTISSFGTGSGGTGTYNLSGSGTVGTATQFVATTTGTSGDTSLTDLALVGDYWVQMEPVYASYQSDIFINIANEWGGYTYPAGTITYAQWESAYESIVSSMRTAGYTCPLVIDIMQYGQDFTAFSGGYAAAVEAADPLQNVIFDVHLYNSSNISGQISGITNATDAVITIDSAAATNPFAAAVFNGTVYISGVQGMTQINGQFVSVTAHGGSSGAWTITTNLNTSSYGTYTSGGIVYDSQNYQTRMQTLQGYIESGIPILIGEFGPPGLNSTTAGISQFVSSAEAYQIPEIYWSWDDGNDWGGGFNAAQDSGLYALNTPSDLAQQMDVILNPRTGLQMLGVPSNYLH